MHSSKINLKDVTLVCADDVDTKQAFMLLTKICSKINFGDVKLFSSNEINNNITLIEPIKDIHDYDNFIYHDLNEHIKTDFCMTVQRDGHPINCDAWKDSFLNFDYIGSPWTWNSLIPMFQCVGNSGFCIRSKKFLEALKEHKYDSKEDGPEDEFVCKNIDYFLRENHEIQFAPYELARWFSVENALYTGQFGFHGRLTRKMNEAIGVSLDASALDVSITQLLT